MQPYLLAAARQASEEGVPAWRPLLLDFPDDTTAWAVDDEFLLGPDLLVAPILEEVAGRKVYLPRAEWMEVGNKERHPGPKTIQYAAKLEVIPLFVRRGSELTQLFDAEAESE